MHLFKNRLLFNLICEFSNNFLHESPIHYNILVHKSWKLHHIFKFFSRILIFIQYLIFFLNYTKRMQQQLQLHPIEYFMIVDKAPCP
jgi:hypothetical protein